MDTASWAMRVKHYLATLEDMPGSRLQDVFDEEIFEVLAGVSWVREALAESVAALAADGQRPAPAGLRSLAT